MQIEELVSAQRAFFNTGATKDAAFRRRALAALRQAVTAREADICAALKEDLHKSPFESYMCETGLVLSELTYMEKHLNRLMRARRAKTPLGAVPRPQLRRARAAGRGAGDEPVELSVHAPRWTRWSARSRRQLRGAQAQRVRAGHQPRFEGACGKLLRAGPYRRRGGRTRGKRALLEQKFDYIFFTAVWPLAGW